jgi:hypothetical protein
VALNTYNVMSVMKAAMRSAHRDPSLLMELSGYYLATEIPVAYWGMMIAIEPRNWTKAFATLSADEMARILKELASQTRVNRFRKHKRGLKRPPPARTGGLREKHASTARLIATRNDVQDQK